VEFQIEKDVRADVRELLNCSRTLGSKQLATDFEEPDCPAKLLREDNSSPDVIDIQGNDQSS
jgi:hypothetical protein